MAAMDILETAWQGGYIPMNNVKLWLAQDTPIEDKAREQIQAMSELPILAGHIAIMPDVHWGKGATVGSVIPTTGAIIPAAVGVDIGCGMAAVQTTIRADQLPDNLSRIRDAIEEAIPVGFNAHEHDRALDQVLALDTGKPFAPRLRELRERFNNLTLHDHLPNKSKHRVEAAVWKQVGTLGGGNHFIELQIGDDGFLWLMLHSGSRNVGKSLAEVAISLARQEAEQRGDILGDKDLAWLVEGSSSFVAYVETLSWAQDYARTNRDMMLALLWRAIEPFLPANMAAKQIINCHHNYVERVVEENRVYWLTRKGAVSAKSGELGIIPGSMGTASYIVRGKGNPDSYYSCSHGAGRRLSRNQAKKQFTVDDLIAQTQGVESRKDEAVLDEIPAAYKDVDAVIQAQADLIEPVVKLKQVLCVKG
ncbi:RNA-splicing ligase RtcB [Sulfobacillus thermosulfidooxidans]|nr:RNA-splicing ligase RtcB [Sulfobacillus thermosulfidooxidans]OLZ13498.1 RNA-splicing ligase RtcB [Sulfobacillus thermosulfidooxidans]OLZ20763.1 RNA-splicing ligase RtcB [Sulfobacillus thermosulfidooxidans]